MEDAQQQRCRLMARRKSAKKRQIRAAARTPRRVKRVVGVGHAAYARLNALFSAQPRVPPHYVLRAQCKQCAHRRPAHERGVRLRAIVACFAE